MRWLPAVQAGVCHPNQDPYNHIFLIVNHDPNSVSAGEWLHYPWLFGK